MSLIFTDYISTHHKRAKWTPEALDALINTCTLFKSHPIWQNFYYSCLNTFKYLAATESIKLYNIKLIARNSHKSTINQEYHKIAYLIERIRTNNNFNYTVLSSNQIYLGWSSLLSDFISHRFFKKILPSHSYPDTPNQKLFFNLIATTIQRPLINIELAFHLTQLLKSNFDHLLPKLDSLMCHSQDVDLSILTSDQLQHCRQIFSTKRRLYIRIFLVLSYTYPISDFFISIEAYSKEDIFTWLSRPVLEVLMLISCL